MNHSVVRAGKAQARAFAMGRGSSIHRPPMAQERVEWVSGSSDVLIRRLRYGRPETAKILTFLTSKIPLVPGLIAFLYKLR